MRSFVLLSAIAASALALSAPAIAQDGEATSAQAPATTPLEMRSRQVVGVLNGEVPPQDVFTQGFLDQVTPETLAALARQWTEQYGPAVSVESIGNPDAVRSALAIRMERAIARGGIAIDPSDDNRVSELVFQNFEALDDSPEKILADLEALPGDVSYWFGPLGGEPVMASDDDPQMPLGSTFKLYVLAALAREVAEGRRDWSDVVTLSDSRSIPSGMMQDWPTGAQVTLETLASLMISISDNTATDALIAALGRETVQQAMVDSGHSDPALNIPFLNTRELFLLKSGPQGRINAYRRKNVEVRSEVLDVLAQLQVDRADVEAAFSGGPVALDIEWFASAADLAALFAFMRETGDSRAFEIMAINPAMTGATRDNWAYAGYKGGSEPGVLNLTWLLTDENAQDHMLVLSWKNEQANVATSALEQIARRILALPR